MTAKRLKELRTNHEYTQAFLSKELKIGQSTIASYENGTREPHISILIAYADYFQCSVDWLIGREDDFGNIVTANRETTAITVDAKELLDIFNSLEREHRAQILEYARYFAQHAHPHTYQRNQNS